jgi:hypothetical protein
MDERITGRTLVGVKAFVTLALRHGRVVTAGIDRQWIASQESFSMSLNDG